MGWTRRACLSRPRVVWRAQPRQRSAVSARPAPPPRARLAPRAALVVPGRLSPESGPVRAVGAGGATARRSLRQGTGRGTALPLCGRALGLPAPPLGPRRWQTRCWGRRPGTGRPPGSRCGRFDSPLPCTRGQWAECGGRRGRAAPARRAGREAWGIPAWGKAWPRWRTCTARCCAGAAHTAPFPAGVRRHRRGECAQSGQWSRTWSSGFGRSLTSLHREGGRAQPGTL